MVQRVATVAFEGIEARVVDVQVQVAPGLPPFSIVGLPDKHGGTDCRDQQGNCWVNFYGQCPAAGRTRLTAGKFHTAASWRCLGDDRRHGGNRGLVDLDGGALGHVLSRKRILPLHCCRSGHGRWWLIIRSHRHLSRAGNFPSSVYKNASFSFVRLSATSCRH
jgi:hypothetical protein